MKKEVVIGGSIVVILVVVAAFFFWPTLTGEKKQEQKPNPDLGNQEEHPTQNPGNQEEQPNQGEEPSVVVSKEQQYYQDHILDGILAHEVYVDYRSERCETESSETWKKCPVLQLKVNANKRLALVLDGVEQELTNYSFRVKKMFFLSGMSLEFSRVFLLTEEGTVYVLYLDEDKMEPVYQGFSSTATLPLERVEADQKVVDLVATNQSIQVSGTKFPFVWLQSNELKEIVQNGASYQLAPVVLP